MLAKRTIPLFIAALIGFLLIATYFIPKTEQWGASAMEMFIILAAAAMVLGAGNLIMLNLAKISNRRPGWAYGAITLLAFFITLLIGVFKVGALPTATSPDNPWTAPLVSQEGVPFWWIYSYVYKPLTATMFAMLAFYIASAAFRAFRAKNIEASLLRIQRLESKIEERIGLSRSVSIDKLHEHQDEVRRRSFGHALGSASMTVPEARRVRSTGSIGSGPLSPRP